MNICLLAIDYYITAVENNISKTEAQSMALNKLRDLRMDLDYVDATILRECEITCDIINRLANI
jgi:hypothetical protein